MNATDFFKATAEVGKQQFGARQKSLAGPRRGSNDWKKRLRRDEAFRQSELGELGQAEILRMWGDGAQGPSPFEPGPVALKPIEGFPSEATAP